MKSSGEPGRIELRLVRLKQWKRGTTTYRKMKRLGATDDAARQVAANSRRWWKNSSKLLNTALPRSYSAEVPSTTSDYATG